MMNYSETKDFESSDQPILIGEVWDTNYWALILLGLCVAVVFGNVLVILSVARERSLQNMTNMFIVSLAVADLCVAGVVMPFYTYTMVNWGSWFLPIEVCDFYLAMDVVCSTSSIFHLVAISIDRFFAVTSPILYSQHRHSHTPAYTVIVLCWASSLAIGLPIMFGLNHRPESIKVDASIYFNTTLKNVTVDQGEYEPPFCGFYNPDFIIYSSLGSFYIPCVIMIVLYTRIFKTLHERAIKAGKPKAPAPTSVPQLKLQIKKPPVVAKPKDISLDCNGCTELSSSSVDASLHQAERQICSRCSQSFISGSSKVSCKVDKNVSTRDDFELKPTIQPKINLVKAKKQKVKKKKDNQRKERKATQTLAIVLASFLVCWVPFFTCNILDALSIKYQLNTAPGNAAFQATTLLGYLNSCLNPIIYTIFNPEFRKAFKRVLGLGH